jgi:hypothetical protein
MKLTCPFAIIYCFFTFPFPTGNKEAVFCYTILCQDDRQILQGFYVYFEWHEKKYIFLKEKKGLF